MKKIYKVRWAIVTEDHNGDFEWKDKECYKATKESAVLTVDNLKSAFEDLGYDKKQIRPMTIEEVTLD